MTRSRPASLRLLHQTEILRLPPGWRLHIHPQGWLYFRHPEQRIVTDDDVRKSDDFDKIQTYITTSLVEELPPGDHFEVLLPRTLEPGERALLLFINHSLQLASYDLSEVTLDSDAYHEPHRREFNLVYASLQRAVARLTSHS